MSTLLATSVTKDGIIRLIAHYWYTTPEHITIGDDGSIWIDDTRMIGYKAVSRCGFAYRWHFYGDNGKKAILTKEQQAVIKLFSTL